MVSITVSAPLSDKFVADSVALKDVPAAMEAGACRLTDEVHFRLGADRARAVVVVQIVFVGRAHVHRDGM